MFKSKYTQWIPFGNHTHGYQHYITFVRKNLKSGMLEFKTKKVQTSFYYGTFLPQNLIDVKKQWDDIISK